MHARCLRHPGVEEPAELAVAVVEHRVGYAEQKAQQMRVEPVGDHDPPGGEEPAPSGTRARAAAS